MCKINDDTFTEVQKTFSQLNGWFLFFAALKWNSNVRRKWRDLSLYRLLYLSGTRRHFGCFVRNNCSLRTAFVGSGVESLRILGMEDSGGVMALQDYISSLDQSSLPRILQVCSGVYFQGKKLWTPTPSFTSYKSL